MKLEAEDGKEGAAGYLFLFNMLKPASRWGSCMITIWAQDDLSDVTGVCCLWSTNNTCQPHTLITLSLEEECSFLERSFFVMHSGRSMRFKNSPSE